MDRCILSYPDITKKCQEICKNYDLEISELILANKPIPIDTLLEGPALLLTEMYSEGESEDVKR